MKPAYEVHQEEIDSFLANAPASAVDNIDFYINDPRLDSIAEMIRNGNWTQFLSDFRTIEDAHYLLMAAFSFCNKTLLTTDELVTAFNFLSAAMADPNYKLIRNNDVNKSGKIPKNLCFGISISKSAWPKDIHRIFDLIEREDDSFLKVEENSLYFFSFAEAKVRLASKNNNASLSMRPRLGVSTRDSYWEDIKNGKTPLAFLTPDMGKGIYVHGVVVEGPQGNLFSMLHDGAHYFTNVQESASMTPIKINFIEALYTMLKARGPLGPQLEEGHRISILSKDATMELLTTRLLDELVSDLMTSEENFNTFGRLHSTKDAFSDLKDHITYIRNIYREEMRHAIKSRQDVAIFTDRQLASAAAAVAALIEPLVYKICVPGEGMENSSVASSSSTTSEERKALPENQSPLFVAVRQFRRSVLEASSEPCDEDKWDEWLSSDVPVRNYGIEMNTQSQTNEYIKLNILLKRLETAIVNNEMEKAKNLIEQITVQIEVYDIKHRDWRPASERYGKIKEALAGFEECLYQHNQAKMTDHISSEQLSFINMHHELNKNLSQLSVNLDYLNRYIKHYNTAVKEFEKLTPGDEGWQQKADGVTRAFDSLVQLAQNHNHPDCIKILAHIQIINNKMPGKDQPTMTHKI